MNVGILVDSSCDIPTSILSRHQVNVLPSTLQLNDIKINDIRNPEKTTELYNQIDASDLATASYQPLSEQNIINYFTDDLIYQNDHIIYIAPHLLLSKSLITLRNALFSIQASVNELRQAANLSRPFKFRIIESGNGYAGYGLVLYETLRLLREKAYSADQILGPINEFKNNITTLVLPGNLKSSSPVFSNSPFNLNWLQSKKLALLKQKPILSINSEGIQKLGQVRNIEAEKEFFDIVYDELTRTSLSNHLINISFAGNLPQLRIIPGFRTLHDHIKSKNGKLVYSNMSPMSAVQLGLGAISVSFAGTKK